MYALPYRFVFKFADGECAVKRAGAVDREGLENMLLRLDAVDLESVSRVSDSKVQLTIIASIFYW